MTETANVTTEARRIYYEHIDGLRAIAIVLVIFNHLGYSWFSGGYIGVDVFFVISGFLITRGFNSQVQLR